MSEVCTRLAAVALAVVAFDRAALAETAPVIAVFSIEDARARPLPRPELDALTGYLAIKLAERRVFRVVPGSEVQAAISAQQAESYRACYDERCQIEIGKQVAAEKSLSTRLVSIGTQCVLTSALFDLRDGATERAASFKGGCSPDELTTAIERVVAQLERPGGADERAVAAPRSTPGPSASAPGPSAPAPSPSPPPSVAAPSLVAPLPVASPADQGAASALARRLATFIQAGRVTLVQAGGQLVVRFPTGVLFDTNRTTLRSSGVQLLGELASALSGVEISEVSAHTDNAGSDRANQKLSEGRAHAVADYLRGTQRVAGPLVARGFGEMRPILPNDTTEGRAQNRRLELVVVP